VTIRRAGPGDAVRLLELSVLDSAEQVTGDVLVAEVDGELWAALEVTSGRVLADPFRPSAAMAELLQIRAARLRAQPHRGRMQPQPQCSTRSSYS
jgi:hypothetical protein